jgi:hypothetical protein
MEEREQDREDRSLNFELGYKFPVSKDFFISDFCQIVCPSFHMKENYSYNLEFRSVKILTFRKDATNQ